MKPGQIIMIFTDPLKCELEDGWAILIKQLETCGDLERWDVEFLDQEGKIYQRLIKKL